MARPSDVTDRLREASRADSLADTTRLVSEAGQIQAGLVAEAAAAREVDLGNAIVHDHLTPVRVHEHHTAATDWVGSVDTSGGEGVTQNMIAQGSLWYSKLHEAVRADTDEFEQQAVGYGRRLAGAYGEAAAVAEEAFLTHVGTLRAREERAGVFAEAASGVGQVGDENMPVAESTVGPPVDPGLPGDATSSNRAPAMQAMDAAPSAQPVLSNGDVDSENGDSGTAPGDAAAKHGQHHRAVDSEQQRDQAGQRAGLGEDATLEQHHQLGYQHGAENVQRDNTYDSYQEGRDTPDGAYGRGYAAGGVDRASNTPRNHRNVRYEGSRRQAGYWNAPDRQPLQVDPSDPNAAWNRWGNSPHWKDHQEGFEHGYLTEDRHRPHDRSTGPGQAYHEGYDLGAHHYNQDLDRPNDFSHFTNRMSDLLNGHESRKEASMQTAPCPSCGGHGRVAVRRQGASGLPQIEEIVDANNNPHAESPPLPTDVMWPLNPGGDMQGNAIAETENQLQQREQLKGAARARVAQRAAEEVYRRVLAGQDDSGWLGPMGAGGVGPGEQDFTGQGPVDSLGMADPVYGQGGDNGNQPLKPYGQDEADDETNKPAQWSPGQPLQNDLGGRGESTAPGASMISQSMLTNDPEMAKAMRFLTQRAELHRAQGRR